MSRKRGATIPDVYKNRKRICAGDSNPGFQGQFDEPPAYLTKTKDALLQLRDLFPTDKFEDRLPPIIAKHQLYSLVKNRTDVDKGLGDLREKKEIRMFKLGAQADQFCVVFTSDYCDHVRKTVTVTTANRTVVEKFLNNVIPCNQDLSLSKHSMAIDFHFKDDEITQLVKASVLTVRDVGSWWVAIPCAGIFMKSFIRGRKAMLTMIRKCKYREIMQSDLEERKLPKMARLGTKYHIHDIIGADLVRVVITTSGPLLRLADS